MSEENILEDGAEDNALEEGIIRRIVLTGIHPDRGLIVLGLIDENRQWYPQTKTLPDYEEFVQPLLEAGFTPQREIEQLRKIGGGQVFFDLKISEPGDTD